MLLWNDRSWSDKDLYSTIELKKNEEYWKYLDFCRQAEEDEQWNDISANVCGMSRIFIWDVSLKFNFSEET